MTAEVEALQAASAAITAIGLPTTIILVLFALYRFERLKVEEIQEARIQEQKAYQQARIDDYRAWLGIQRAMRGEGRTITNLGP